MEYRKNHLGVFAVESQFVPFLEKSSRQPKSPSLSLGCAIHERLWG